MAHTWFGGVACRLLLTASLGCAPLAVFAAPDVSVSIVPSTIPFGSSATLTLTLNEPTGFVGPQIAFFSLPPGLVNAAGAPSNGCGGALTAPTGSPSIQLSGTTVSGTTSCAIQLPIEAISPGSYSVIFPAGSLADGIDTNLSDSNTAGLVVTAPTLLVTTDLDDGTPGSLRDAINTANGNCATAPSTILFNIPGAGAHVIKVQSTLELPSITCSGTVIDGYSQPGSAPNSSLNAAVDNAAIQVEIDGSLCGGCPWGLNISNGATVTIQGLAIHSFALSTGILASSGTVSVSGNFIGLDSTGVTAHANGNGITANDGVLFVGSGSPADANVISGNTDMGVFVQSLANATIIGNLIGGDRNGANAAANARGIVLDTSGRSSFIGGNFVRYNSGAGVSMYNGSFAKISANAIFANGGIGIDNVIGSPGPTTNQTPELGSQQNYPIIDSVVHTASDTLVSGSLASGFFSLTGISIELFHNSAPSANTQGEKPIAILGPSDFVLQGTGLLTFSRLIPGILADNVSATAIVCGDGCPKSTSEFSPSVAVSDPLVVTNTADSGAGSLRDAISFVNSNCAPPNVITFNIPGAGIQTIIPATPLPPLTCGGMMVDGYSQPGANANTLAIGSDAQLLIEIDGRAASGANGIEIGASGIIVRGLIIDNFGAQAGIFVNAPAGTSSVQIYGNILGDPTGTRLKKNSLGVLNTSNTVGLAIGTGNPGDRNVISGNDIGVWLQSGGGTALINNYIGTDASGKNASGNDTGIAANAAANGLTLIGNVVAANLNNGISLGATGAVQLIGNWVGTNEGGDPGLGNGFDGIQASNPAIIGSISPGTGNVIAFNGNDGVNVGGQGVEIRGNSIYGNGSAFYGISLNGVAPSIDHCDVDSGANGQQNYPVITAATLAGGNITLSGTLDSIDLVSYQLDFYSSLAADNASNRAGRTFVGTVPATTSFAGTCSTPWTVTLPYAGAAGDLITATATDPSGNTSWFSVALPVTAGTVPGAPLIGTATGGNGQATVAFTAPASDGGAPITNYTATSSPGGITAIGTSSPIVVIGLTNGTAYTFTVTATNSAGTGAPSAPSNAVTPLAPVGTPGAPTIGTATAGNAQATVAFTPPASDGGSPITGYVATSSPSGITASGTGSPITVTGLVNGTTYTFSVVAMNVVGPGPASAASNAVTPAAPGPSVGLTPAGLTFTARTVSTTSPPQTITLTNSGAGTLAISSIAISGDFAFTSACGASLAAGATCTLSVTFTPLATGTRTGTLTIADNAPGSPHNVSLSGTGQVSSAAIAQVVPSSGDFAPQEVGTTSAPELFVITNVGNSTLVFSDITVTGTGFTLQPTVTSPSYQRCGPTILSGAVCAVEVTFSAPAAGSFAGLLRIASNATNSPVDVNLQASGVVAVPVRALSVPSSLDFPDQAVGTQSDGRQVAITNNSAGAVSITGLTASGDFAVSDTCTTIAAHATCLPLVTFAPTALGLRSGSLSIHALSEATPYLVELTGNGVFSDVPRVSLSLTRLGFGNTLIGAPVTAHVILTNVGTVPVNLLSVLARAQFLVSHACPFTIPVHGTCDITVGFFPSLVGPIAGTIEIATNAAGSPHDVQVSGVGCAIPSLSRSRSGQPVCGP